MNIEYIEETGEDVRLRDIFIRTRQYGSNRTRIHLGQWQFYSEVIEWSIEKNVGRKDWWEQVYKKKGVYGIK